MNRYFKCLGHRILDIDPKLNDGYPKTLVDCGYRFDPIEIEMARFPHEMKCPRCKVHSIAGAIEVIKDESEKS